MNEFQRGLEAAAQIADTYATENFRLAADTVLCDRFLSGKDHSETAMRQSAQMIQDGFMHATSAHAAQWIAEAIRAKL